MTKVKLRNIELKMSIVVMKLYSKKCDKQTSAIHIHYSIAHFRKKKLYYNINFTKKNSF